MGRGGRLCPGTARRHVDDVPTYRIKRCRARLLRWTGSPSHRMRRARILAASTSGPDTDQKLLRMIERRQARLGEFDSPDTHRIILPDQYRRARRASHRRNSSSTCPAVNLSGTGLPAARSVRMTFTRPRLSPWVLVAVVAAGTFITALDQTVVITVLPAIMADLKIPIPSGWSRLSGWSPPICWAIPRRCRCSVGWPTFTVTGGFTWSHAGRVRGRHRHWLRCPANGGG